MTDVPLVQIERVSKSFDSTQALRDVSFSVAPGEFIGLVGPNGAGKSTLVKILDGVYTPDRGTIRLSGSARTGGRGGIRGIGVVHQDLGVVGTLTVAENLRLGLAPLRAFGPILSSRKEREFCTAALAAVGLEPRLADTMMESLTLGEQTLVAIARTIAVGAEVVVIDEATSALSPSESQWLLRTLRQRAATGAAVIMVSHKMSEIIETTDRCVVIVDGVVAADVATADTDVAELGQLMAPGRVLAAASATTDDVAEHGPSRSSEPDADVVLELQGASSAKAGPFDLVLHAGEVVGVTGLVGSGLYDLAMIACGMTRTTRGRRRIAPGVRVGLLPPHRATQANFPDQTGGWNLTVGTLGHWRNRAGLLNLHREYRDVVSQYAVLGVNPPDPGRLHGSLSGGNQQKILLGRVLLQGKRCLVLCEPTRGVDVRTRREIYRLVREAVADGHGVLVVSSDGEDLLALAHRVGVVREGRLSELAPVGSLDAASLAGLL